MLVFVYEVRACFGHVLAGFSWTSSLLSLRYSYYDTTFRRVPHGKILRDGVGGIANQDSLAPWAVMLLPFLEQEARQRGFVFESPFFGMWNSPAPAPNEEGQLRRFRQWACPSDPNSNGENTNSNYFGVQGGGSSPELSGGDRQSEPHGVWLYSNFLFVTQGVECVTAIRSLSATRSKRFGLYDAVHMATTASEKRRNGLTVNH